MHAHTHTALLSHILFQWHSGQNSRGWSGKAAGFGVFVSEADTWQKPAKPVGDPLGLWSHPPPSAALLCCRWAGSTQLWLLGWGDTILSVISVWLGSHLDFTSEEEKTHLWGWLAFLFLPKFPQSQGLQNTNHVDCKVRGIEWLGLAGEHDCPWQGWDRCGDQQVPSAGPWQQEAAQGQSCTAGCLRIDYCWRCPSLFYQTPTRGHST